MKYTFTLDIDPELFTEQRNYLDTLINQSHYQDSADGLIGIQNMLDAMADQIDAAPKTPAEFSLANFTAGEQAAISTCLKAYFPWLGSDYMEAEGAETVNDLDYLYRALPHPPYNDQCSNNDDDD